MVFIGDVHAAFKGQAKKFMDVLGEFEGKPIIQLGDLNLGFPSLPKLWLPDNVKFIRGNHDNPETCRKHPNYLGDYGYIEKANLYFISGAFSIDYENSIPGKTWWPDEELSEVELATVAQEISLLRPDIIVSHDCPEAIFNRMYPWMLTRPEWRSRTRIWFNSIFQLHQPKYWIFGHHHENIKTEILGTIFICVDVNNAIEIPGVDF